MSEIVGQKIRLTFNTYSDAAGTVLADPDALTLELKSPTTTTTLSWPTPADITRDSVGTFHYDFIPAVGTDGNYAEFWQATSVASGINTARRGTFTVDPAFDSPAAFATPDQLAASLGIAVPTDETTLAMWTTALDDASNHLRTVIGQPINAGTVTLTLPTDSRGEADIFLVPVTSITTVTDPEGVVVVSSDYALKDQRLYLRRACVDYTVTLAYGYAKVPAEIVRWTKILAAAQIQVAPTGSLGVDNITSVAVDDGKMSYADGNAVELPPATAQWLKATFGGPQ